MMLKIENFRIPAMLILLLMIKILLIQILKESHLKPDWKGICIQEEQLFLDWSLLKRLKLKVLNQF